MEIPYNGATRRETINSDPRQSYFSTVIAKLDNRVELIESILELNVGQSETPGCRKAKIFLESRVEFEDRSGRGDLAVVMNWVQVSEMTIRDRQQIQAPSSFLETFLSFRSILILFAAGSPLVYLLEVIR